MKSAIGQITCIGLFSLGIVLCGASCSTHSKSRAIQQLPSADKTLFIPHQTKVYKTRPNSKAQIPPAALCAICGEPRPCTKGHFRGPSPELKQWFAKSMWGVCYLMIGVGVALMLSNPIAEILKAKWHVPWRVFLGLMFGGLASLYLTVAGDLGLPLGGLLAILISWGLLSWWGHAGSSDVTFFYSTRGTLKRSVESLQRDVLTGIDSVDTQTKQLGAWDQHNNTVLLANTKISQFNTAVDALRRMVQRIRNANTENRILHSNEVLDLWPAIYQMYHLEYRDRILVTQKPKAVSTKISSQAAILKITDSYHALKKAVERYDPEHSQSIEEWRQTYPMHWAPIRNDHPILIPIIEDIKSINDSQPLATLLSDYQEDHKQDVLKLLAGDTLTKRINSLEHLKPTQ